MGTRYIKLKGTLIPIDCRVENGQVISECVLDLATLFLFDLEPVDKSKLNEQDRLALDDWYQGKDVKRWWVHEMPVSDATKEYQQEMLSKSPMEWKREIEGEWEQTN